MLIATLWKFHLNICLYIATYANSNSIEHVSFLLSMMHLFFDFFFKFDKRLLLMFAVQCFKEPSFNQLWNKSMSDGK